jgi:hypothetical protein
MCEQKMNTKKEEVMTGEVGRELLVFSASSVDSIRRAEPALIGKGGKAAGKKRRS